MFGTGFNPQPTFGSSSPGGFGTWGQQTPVKQEKYAESGFSGGFNQPPQSASPFSGGGAFAFGSVASTPAPGVNPGSNPFKKQDSGGPRNQALGGRGGRGRGRGPAVTGASNDRYSHTFDGFGDRNIPPDNPFPGGAPASFFAAGGRTGRDSSNSWRDHARGADSGAPLAGRGTGGLTRQYNCRVCQQQFSDRPQLQQHLADSGHYNTPVSTDPQSSQQRFSQSQESLPDGRGGRGRNRGGVDNGGNPQPFVSRPSSGYSSMMQRHIGGQVDNARAHGSGRFGGRGDNFDGRGWGRLNGRQKTDQRPVSPKNLAPTISWRDNTNGSQINSGPDTTYNSAAADAEAMDDPNADESQLEYSEDDDNEGANGSETSHVSVEDNSEEDVDENSDAGSAQRQQTGFTMTTFASALNNQNDRWSGGGVTQQAPPGTASSNNLLNRLKKKNSTQAATQDYVTKGSEGDNRDGPTVDKPFFSKKFSAKATDSSAVTFSSSTKSGGNASTANFNDYSSGQSGEERSGPTADKPFFSKKFSAKPTDSISRAANRDNFDTSEYDSDSSPMKTTLSAPGSSLHVDGQLVGICMDMCPLHERQKRIDEKDVNRLELPYPKGYSDISFKGNTVDLSDPGRTMVKKLQRSAADHVLAIPELVRPPPVLLRAMRYLQQFVMEKDLQSIPDVRFGQVATQIEVYLFVWDRLRMIAKDFILQNYRYGGRNDRYCIECYENMARWHIMMEHQMHNNDEYRAIHTEQNYEQLNRYLKSLNEIYDDAATRRGSDGNRLLECPNESEFRAYYIFQQLDNEGQVEAYIPCLSEEVLASAEIQFALAIVAARRNENYAKFFRLFREGTYLEACSLFRYVGYMRIQALRVMCKIYRPAKQEVNYPIIDMQRLMLFDSLGDTIEFFDYCQMTLLGDEDSEMFVVLDGRNVIDSLPVHKKSGAPVLPETKSMNAAIEGKTQMSRGDIVLGQSGRHSIAYEGTADDEQAFFRAQLLQRKMATQTSMKLTPSKPAIPFNTVSGKLHERGRLDGTEVIKESKALVNSHVVAKPPAVPAIVFSPPAVVATPAVLAPPAVVVPSVEKPRQDEVKPAGTPFQFNATKPSVGPVITANSDDLPNVPLIPSAPLKTTFATTESIPKSADVPTPPQVDAPTSIIPSSFNNPAAASAPFTFAGISTVKDAASASASSVSADKLDKISHVNTPIVQNNFPTAPLGIQLPITPTVKGIGLSPHVVKTDGANDLSKIAASKLYSFDEFYPSETAVNSVQAKAMPIIAASPVAHQAAYVEEFDNVAASAKILKAVRFAPRSNFHFNRGQDHTVLHSTSKISQQIPESPKSSCLSPVSKEMPQSEVDLTPTYEEYERRLYSKERHLSQRIRARCAYKSFHVWRISANEQNIKLQTFYLSISFHKWRRVYEKRVGIKMKMVQTLRSDDDVSLSMLTRFSHLSFVSKKLRVEKTERKSVDLFKPIKLLECRKALTVEILPVSSILGSYLYKAQNVAYRDLFFGNDSIRINDLSWPRDLFVKLAIISTDRHEFVSKSGYFMPADNPILSAIRGLLCHNISSQYDGDVVSAKCKDSVTVSDRVNVNVHTHCIDYRNACNGPNLCHAAVVMCPLEIIQEYTHRNNSNAASSFIELTRSVLDDNTDVPVVLFIVVNDELESPSWGEIDMLDKTRSPPWGITINAIQAFLRLTNISRLKGVFAVNTSQIASIDDEVVGSLSTNCIQGMLCRLADNGITATCPLLQRLNVCSWVLQSVQAAVVRGLQSNEDAIGDWMTNVGPAQMIRYCISNANKAVHDCLIRIEHEISAADNDKLKSILASSFELTSDGFEGVVPNCLLDDWANTRSQCVSRSGIQQLLNLIDGRLLTKDNAVPLLSIANSILASMQLAEEPQLKGDRGMDDVIFAIPSAVLRDLSRDKLCAAHKYVSSFWLPPFNDSDDSKISTITDYCAALKAGDWELSDSGFESVVDIFKSKGRTESPSTHYMQYCAIMKWLCKILQCRQKKLSNQFETDDFSIYLGFKSDHIKFKAVPLQIELLSRIKDYTDTPNRKRPWDGSLEEIQYDNKVKSRCDESMSVLKSEGGDQLDLLFNAFYPLSSTTQPLSITEDSIFEESFLTELESARRLEDRLYNLLKVDIVQLNPSFKHL